MGYLCFLLLFMALWLVLVWAAVVAFRNWRGTRSGGQSSRWKASQGSRSYESPLGLVDRPEDEWLEWAIMDDILDGPDEGLF